MPLYEVSHFTPLSAHQQERLAQHITYAHSRQFHTPSMFVNVVYKDISQAGFFVGGKKRSTNSISAHVRPGGDRSSADFDAVCSAIAEAWAEIVKPRYPEDELRSIFVLGSIVAGWEAGFALPPAGGDGAWIERNMAAFREKAEAGDEDFAGLVKEVAEREDLSG